MWPKRDSSFEDIFLSFYISWICINFLFSPGYWCVISCQLYRHAHFCLVMIGHDAYFKQQPKYDDFHFSESFMPIPLSSSFSPQKYRYPAPGEPWKNKSNTYTTSSHKQSASSMSLSLSFRTSSSLFRFIGCVINSFFISFPSTKKAPYLRVLFVF